MQLMQDDTKYQELSDEQLDQVVGGQGPAAAAAATFTAAAATPTAIAAVRSAGIAAGPNVAGAGAAPTGGTGLGL